MPDAETNEPIGKSTPGERCGRCGEIVVEASELCPYCGALLAAYRTAETAAIPPSSPPVRTQIVIPDREPGVAIEPALEPNVPAVSNELRAARIALLATLIAPERQLMAAVRAESHAIEPRPSESKPIERPKLLTSAEAKPSPVATVTGQVAHPPTPTPVRPKKPGFVSVAPVEPVMIIGSILVGIAFALVVCASLTSSRSVAIVAFFCGAVGIFAAIVAVLAVLIQRDRNRD